MVPAPAALTAFAMVNVPVLVTLTLPPPVCAMPLTINAEPLVNVISPLVVFVAAKPKILLLLFRPVPPTDDVVKAFPLIAPAVWPIVLVDVKLMLLAPTTRLPFNVIAPVLLIETSPVPLCVIAPVVNANPFVSEITPIPVFVAANPVTVFALFNVVPIAEVVVNKPPFNKPPVASLTVPAVPVKVIPPVVLNVAPVKVTLRPAIADKAPEALLIFAFAKISLVAPVAVKETVPAPAALQLLLLIVKVPALVTATLPPAALCNTVNSQSTAIIKLYIAANVVLAPVKLKTVFRIDHLMLYLRLKGVVR